MPAARNDLVKYPIEFKIYCVPNCLGTAGGSAHAVHFENLFYSHCQADLCAQGSGIFLPLAFWLDTVHPVFRSFQGFAPRIFLILPDQVRGILFHPIVGHIVSSMHSAENRQPAILWFKISILTIGWGLSEVDFRGAVVWLGACQPATERRKMKNTKNKSTAVALVIPGADN